MDDLLGYGYEGSQHTQDKDVTTPEWLQTSKSAEEHCENYENILVICTGNICRSAYAEVRLRQLSQNSAKIVSVSSAGISAVTHSGADECLAQRALVRGVDLAGHQARQLNIQMLKEADRVLIFDSEHAEWILRHYPEYAYKVVPIGALTTHTDIWIADPYGKDQEFIDKILARIDESLEIFVSKEWYEVWEFQGRKSEEIDVETFEAAQRFEYSRRTYRWVKRVFDIAISLTVLICLSPLFVLISLAIKISEPRGTVFFRQVRVGYKGHEFKMFKFRTMVMGAEEQLQELMEANEKDGPVFKIASDPRITPLGRFLRKVSLDELPQFLNVLRGELAIVGPRPALPSEVCRYSAKDRQRLSVPQGLTCLWQIRINRDAVPFKIWMELDRRYIRTCSLWLDLKIIIQTLGVIVRAMGK